MKLFSNFNNFSYYSVRSFNCVGVNNFSFNNFSSFNSNRVSSVNFFVVSFLVTASNESGSSSYSEHHNVLFHFL